MTRQATQRDLLQDLVEANFLQFRHLRGYVELQHDSYKSCQQLLNGTRGEMSRAESMTLIKQIWGKTKSNDLGYRLMNDSSELKKLGYDDAKILTLLYGLWDSKDLAMSETSSHQKHHRRTSSQGPGGPPQPSAVDWSIGTDQPVRKSVTGRQQTQLSKAELSKVMVKEVLYACHAVNGKYLTMPSDDTGNFLIDPALPAPMPERQLMLKLAELGWLVRRLSAHANPSRDGQGDGAVRQAFQGALRQELADFQRLLASLEAMANNPLPTPENPDTGSYLTLRRLLVWFGEPLVRMKWLTAIADSAANVVGGQLLATLELAAAHGQPVIRSVLLRCLKLAAVPYLAQVWLWVFQGRLEDFPSSKPEFFIIPSMAKTAKDVTGYGKLWREGYRLEESMRSPFISAALANRILRAGKSLNFLRECCGDTEWTQQAGRTSLASAASKLQYDQAEALESVVTKAGTDIDKHVVEVLLDKFQLGAHCGAIKRYLLLGQGDFIEALMDNVGNDLSKPASEISEYSLGGYLDAALRASSAQYDAPDQINRLRIKLDIAQQNDIGWDAFTLKYDVEEPIATVLDHAAMKAYLQIFRLLWALKRAEHSLNTCWVDLNSVQRQLSAFPGYVRKSGLQSYSMERVWEDLRQCHRLRNEMAHLVASLQGYIMFEVVEAAWTVFTERLKTTQDLDGLIQAHEEYLHSLLRKTLLEDLEKVSASHGSMASQSNVQLELRSLVQQTLELRPRIKSLADTVNDACFKARSYVNNAIIAEARGQWGSDGLTPTILGVRPEDLERVQTALDNLDRNYGDRLARFVDLLPSADHVDLRFLLFRLEAGGKGRVTDDGGRYRGTDDGT